MVHAMVHGEGVGIGACHGAGVDIGSDTGTGADTAAGGTVAAAPGVDGVAGGTVAAAPGADAVVARVAPTEKLYYMKHQLLSFVMAFIISTFKYYLLMFDSIHRWADPVGP